MITGEGRSGKTAFSRCIVGIDYEETQSTVGINEFMCSVNQVQQSGDDSATGWSKVEEYASLLEDAVASQMQNLSKIDSQENKSGTEDMVAMMKKAWSTNERREEDLTELVREKGKDKGNEVVEKSPHPSSVRPGAFALALLPFLVQRLSRHSACPLKGINREAPVAARQALQGAEKAGGRRGVGDEASDAISRTWTCSYETN